MAHVKMKGFRCRVLGHALQSSGFSRVLGAELCLKSQKLVNVIGYEFVPIF